MNYEIKFIIDVLTQVNYIKNSKKKEVINIKLLSRS